MAMLKCKMCGGDLNVVAGVSVCECEYCGTKQTVPAANDEKKLVLFARANRLRLECDFDKAAGVYEAIVADFSDEAEAYWGLVLCRYGIEYVDDPKTGKKIPTCHRSSFESVLEDNNFQMALDYADPMAREVYREEARQMEQLRRGIIAVSSKEEPYDIFICYKETDDKGQRTIDSVIAQDVYTALTEKGYRVFFSRISLEDKLGVEYEPYIFAALHSSKVMLAFGTSYEHYTAVWVKNEWSRFLQLIEKGEKKMLIPCYKDIDPYDMPKEFAKLQAQDMGKVGAMQDLLRGIEKILGTEKPKVVEVVKGSAQNTIPPEVMWLKRAFLFLEDGEWNQADAFCEQVLNRDPECGEAWLAKLMALLKVHRREDLKQFPAAFYEHTHFKKAVRFGDAKLKAELNGYVSHIYETAYQKAVAAMNSARGEAGYRQAIKLFEPVRGYKDADELAQQCEKIARKKGRRSAWMGLLITLAVLALIAFVFFPWVNCQSGDYAMYINLYNVEEYTVDEGTTHIQKEAFADCETLKKVNLPESVTVIGENAFENCTNLTEITLPNSVTEVDAHAFSGCTGLTEMTLPEGVDFIGYRAFAGCTGLTVVTIPATVTHFGSEVFAGCDNLTDIYYGGTLEQWQSLEINDVPAVRVHCTDGSFIAKV